MKRKYLLKNGRVVSGKQIKVMDILIYGETIYKMGVDLVVDQEEVEVIDVTDKLIFPGFIDGHTHFDLEVAGTVTADNFDTGTKAAIVGGTTCIVDFVDQKKGQTLQDALSLWQKKAKGHSSCDFGFHMSIEDWNEKTREELISMFQEGITSFKLYMTYSGKVSDGEIFQILTVLKGYEGIVGVHCENSELIEELTKKQKEAGHNGPFAHPLGRPASAEAEAIFRLLTIAKEVDIPIMIVHLSSKEGYEVIKHARDKGQKVFVETCPQYLLMNEELYKQPGFEGAKYMISPPLRTKEDQECLWEGVISEFIDTIATDHCSFTLAQKEMGRADFTKTPGGMPGVETRVALMYTYGVVAGKITEEQMCRLLAENPAKLYGMFPQKGLLAEGSDADIVIWDPEYEGVISVKSQMQNVDYAPFEGTKIKGRPENVFLRGALIVDKGKIVIENQGKYIKRAIGKF